MAKHLLPRFETDLAEIAFEVLGSAVPYYMLLQITFLSEGLIAVLNQALVRLLF